MWPGTHVGHVKGVAHCGCRGDLAGGLGRVSKMSE